MTELERALQLIESAAWEQVEDDWIQHLQTEAPSIEYFAAVAEALGQAGESERAEFLLGLLDDHLKDNGAYESRLEFLRSSGASLLVPVELHDEALATLRKLYANCPSLEGLIDKVGLYRAVEDSKKNWQKIDRLRQLMQFEVGTVVAMEGQGAGKISEVNLELESLKVDLETQQTLRVGFAAAAKLLIPLPSGHILRRKLEEPMRLREMASASEGELIGIVLRSYSQPLMASEIRQILQGIIEPNQWNGWWSNARKHPQVITVGSGARQRYSWASSQDHAIEALRRAFAAGSAHDKLDLLRKNAKRSPDLVGEMTQELARQATEALARGDEDLAMTIWYALDRENAAGDIEWSPPGILREAAEPGHLISKISDRSIRERLYLDLPESRHDWSKIFTDAFSHEDDPRLLSALSRQLTDHDPQLLHRAIDDVTSQPQKFPAAFTWLAENANSEAFTGHRNPLRLLRQVLAALHRSEFANFRSRLTRTLERGGPVTTLLSRLDQEQAPQAEQALHRAPVDEHIRDSLISALHVRFPELDGKRETPLYATTAAMEQRRKELKEILEEEIPANRRAIEEARALGDLSENFEYKSARQRHEYLTARAESLQRDLSRARPFEVNTTELSEARIGCCLTFSADDQQQRQITILGPWESDPERGIVSYDSDLGQELLGMTVGESAELEGKTMTLDRIDRWSQ